MSETLLLHAIYISSPPFSFIIFIHCWMFISVLGNYFFFFFMLLMLSFCWSHWAPNEKDANVYRLCVREVAKNLHLMMWIHCPQFSFLAAYTLHHNIFMVRRCNHSSIRYTKRCPKGIAKSKVAKELFPPPLTSLLLYLGFCSC